MPVTPFTIEAIGLIAACCTTFCWLPQAIRTIRTRDTRALSLWTQVAFTFGVALWLVYGLLLSSTPLIVANGMTLVLAGTITALKLRFG